MPESNSNGQRVRSEQERLRRRVKIAAQIACLEQYREALTQPEQPAVNNTSSTNKNEGTTAK